MAMSARKRGKTFEEIEPGLGLDAALDEAWRCLQCQDPPCEKGCPAQVPVRTFIRKIRSFDFMGAAQVVLRANVLGGSCARVCATDDQCQRECTRSKMDRPVDIAALQRFVTDFERDQGAGRECVKKQSDKKAAVIGAGPAGLAAAAELARLGIGVTVFERLPRAGGMLSFGIPAARLPNSVVGYEIKCLERMGVDFKLGETIQDIQKLKKNFKAVVVAIGLTQGVHLGIPGEKLPGVHQALEVLGQKTAGKKPKLGPRVVVIGGGNTAMDAATTALHAGAREVTVLYRRSDAEMPAWGKEIARARQQGVRFRSNTIPTALIKVRHRVGKIRCLVTVPGPQDKSGRRKPIPVKGSRFELLADDVIVAAGEEIDRSLALSLGLKLGRDGLVKRGRKGSAGTQGVFVAGDLTRWDRTVVQAVADGVEAARGAAAFLGLGQVEDCSTALLPPEVDLGIRFCNVRFINPFVLAAAPPTDDLDMLRNGLRAGWAGAVLKTTAVEGEPVQLKYPMMAGISVYSRRVVGLGNIDLISEHHIDVVENRIRILKQEFPDRVIIGSIMGSKRSDWEGLVKRLEAAGADIIECSFSCPQGTLGGEGSFSGQMLGQNVELTREVTSWIKGAAKRTPVVIKITPQVADISAVARAVREGGADAICASNTIPGLMGIDLQTMTPQPDVNGLTSFAGLSGPAILPITLRNIALVARHGGLPVTGTGGPVHWKDAVQMMAVGAVNVQFCTAVMTFGYEIIEDLKSGLAWYLRSRGLSSPQPLIGEALPRITTHDRLEPANKVRSRIEEKACVECGRCFIVCRDGGHQAIGFGVRRRPVVDDEKCVGCGMCAAVCPITGCIRMAATGSA